MKTIMAAKSPHGSSFSFSRRYFAWRKKALDEDDDEEEILKNITSSSHFSEDDDHYRHMPPSQLSTVMPIEKKKHSNSSKLKSALTVFTKSRSSSSSTRLGTRVVGTLFGYRRGHVSFAFQECPKLGPAVLIQLAMRTSVLVREMASGLVRIALECDKEKEKGAKLHLLEEPVWRTYCNGRKCGYANRRECGPHEWSVLKAVGPVSMGAGVLPMTTTATIGGGGSGDCGSELGELMYMRARYERVVGSKDSEAFYMMNPEGSGGPELSIFLLRV